MFEKWGREEFDSIGYWGMIELLKKDGRLFPSIEKARIKGGEAHHIIPIYIQGKDRKDPSLDDRCVRVSYIDHVALHIKGALEFGGDWVNCAMFMLNTNNLSDISFVNCEHFAMIREKIARGKSEDYKNLRWITNGKERKRINKDETLPNGWKYGGCPSIGHIWITNGDISIHIPKEEKIPEGWRKGRGNSPLKDYIWINNGKENKRIRIEEEIPQGWDKGTLSRSTKNKMWITNGSINTLIDSTLEIPNGWYKGQTRDPLRSKKVWITNRVNNKQIYMDEPLPNGWEYGRTYSPASNRMWITNEVEERMIPRDSDIPLGWRKGKKPK